MCINLRKNDWISIGVFQLTAYFEGQIQAPPLDLSDKALEWIVVQEQAMSRDRQRVAEAWADLEEQRSILDEQLRYLVNGWNFLFAMFWSQTMDFSKFIVYMAN